MERKARPASWRVTPIKKAGRPKYLKKLSVNQDLALLNELDTESLNEKIQKS
ncbi:MAG: hypothetical protein Q7U59_09355 [Lutibacter sp.]|nr:hypothetical protein [Lutibacter sp.]